MPRDYDPYEYRIVDNPIEDWKIFLHILKSCLGSGILAIPCAVSYAGLWLGVLLILVTGIVVTYCIYLLVDSSLIMCTRLRVPFMTFDQVGENAVLHGYPRFRKFSKYMKYGINWSMIFYLLGCCSVYAIFVAKNLKHVMDEYTVSKISVRTYLLILIPFFLVYITIRSLETMAPVSFIANVLVFIGLMIAGEFISNNLPSLSDRPSYLTDPKNYVFFYGIALFALEGICVILPLENHMSNPEHLIHGPRILFIGFGVVTVLYAGAGLMGYWKFGKDIQEIISLNLDSKEIPCQIANMFFSFAIYQSFGLQFYVPFNKIWRPHVHNFKEWNIIIEIATRWVIGAICIMVGYAHPKIGSIMTLIGVAPLTCLGIIFPCIIDLSTHYGEKKRNRWLKILNSVLLIAGLIGFFGGSVICILDIIKNFERF